MKLDIIVGYFSEFDEMILKLFRNAIVLHYLCTNTYNV